MKNKRIIIEDTLFIAGLISLIVGAWLEIGFLFILGVILILIGYYLLQKRTGKLGLYNPHRTFGR